MVARTGPRPHESIRTRRETEAVPSGRLSAGRKCHIGRGETSDPAGQDNRQMDMAGQGHMRPWEAERPRGRRAALASAQLADWEQGRWGGGAVYLAGALPPRTRHSAPSARAPPPPPAPVDHPPPLPAAPRRCHPRGSARSRTRPAAGSPGDGVGGRPRPVPRLVFGHHPGQRAGLLPRGHLLPRGGRGGRPPRRPGQPASPRAPEDPVRVRAAEVGCRAPTCSRKEWQGDRNGERTGVGGGGRTLWEADSRRVWSGCPDWRMSWSRAFPTVSRLLMLLGSVSVDLCDVSPVPAT